MGSIAPALKPLDSVTAAATMKIVGSYQDESTEVEFASVPPTHEEFLAQICAGLTVDPAKATMTWEDDEGDQICLDNYDDLCEAFYVAETMSSTLRVNVTGEQLTGVDPARRNRTTVSLEVGPIWSQAHAEQVAQEYLDTHPGHTWSHHWWTTVPDKMSVLQITMPTADAELVAAGVVWRPTPAPAPAPAPLEAAAAHDPPAVVLAQEAMAEDMSQYEPEPVPAPEPEPDEAEEVVRQLREQLSSAAGQVKHEAQGGFPASRQVVGSAVAQARKVPSFVKQEIDDGFPTPRVIANQGRQVAYQAKEAITAEYQQDFPAVRGVTAQAKAAVQTEVHTNFPTTRRAAHEVKNTASRVGAVVREGVRQLHQEARPVVSQTYHRAAERAAPTVAQAWEVVRNSVPQHLLGALNSLAVQCSQSTGPPGPRQPSQSAAPAPAPPAPCAASPRAVAQLAGMGFSEECAAAALAKAGGDVAAAVDALLQAEADAEAAAAEEAAAAAAAAAEVEMKAKCEELAEMGFLDERTNREVLGSTHGVVNAAVKVLLAKERAARCRV